MKKLSRELSAKHKLLKSSPDALYSSRMFKTFFNKFMKQGKKLIARRHVFKGLNQLRFTVARPCTFNYLTQILQSLRVQLLLVPRRKAKRIINVPVPVRRNKRELLSLQSLYSSINRRKVSRLLSENIVAELVSLTFDQNQSPLLRDVSKYKQMVFDERVNMDSR